jgi:DNA-binding CsgD family transcriptional regulator
MTEFVHCDDRVKLKDSFSRISYGEFPDLADIRLINNEGQEINLISRTTPVLHENKMLGIRWSGIDVKPVITSIFAPDYTFFEKYKFSPREKEIIEFILQGYKNKEIAEKLYISESAIKYHTSYIYSKMNIKNKDEFFDNIRNYQVGRYGQSSFLFSILSHMMKA